MTNYQLDIGAEPFDVFTELLETKAVDGCIGLPQRMILFFKPQNGWSQAKNATVAPYRYICNIVSTFTPRDESSPTPTFSGVLIDDRLVLTVAHAVSIEGATAQEVFIVPGGSSTPFGATIATKLFIPAKYTPPKLLKDGTLDWTTVDFEHDFALIATKDRLTAGFWGKGITADDAQGTTLGAITGWRPGHYHVNVCGYPRSQPANAPWCSYDATLKSLSAPSLLFFRNKLCQGHSGSPVWVKRSPDLGGRILFAIFVGWKFVTSTKAQPCGRLIDQTVLAFIEAVRRGKKVGSPIKL